MRRPYGQLDKVPGTAFTARRPNLVVTGKKLRSSKGRNLAYWRPIGMKEMLSGNVLTGR